MEKTGGEVKPDYNMISLRRAVQLLEAPMRNEYEHCKNNADLLHYIKTVHRAEGELFKWRKIFHRILQRAIYTRKWRKVTYLLSRDPTWRQHNSKELQSYIIGLTILLIHNPDKKAQSLLGDYVDMAKTCNIIRDQKRLFRELLTLARKLYGRAHRG